MKYLCIKLDWKTMLQDKEAWIGYMSLVGKKPKEDDASLSCFKASSQMLFPNNITQTLVAAFE